ncbi:MAG: 30S ribosomal protein S3 [Nanoarchaeota archaeon]
MIERKIVSDNFLEFQVTNYIRDLLGDVPIEKISIEQNPLGERIIIHTSTPGLVIGREGANIKKLTTTIKKEFKFENPQIKIKEVDQIFLSARIVAKRISNDLSNFGSQKFKLTGFKTMNNVLNSGAMGVEIKITGKLPSSRSKSWRFAKGYLKKTGFVSDFLIDKAIEKVTLKTGVVGIQVSIMLKDTPLPDKIEYFENVVPEEMIKKVEEEKKQEGIVEKNESVVEKQDNLVGERKEVVEKKERISTTKKSIPKEEDQKINKKENLNSKVKEDKIK